MIIDNLSKAAFGRRFIHKYGRHCYEWEIISNVISDAFGMAFVWAKPTKRLTLKKKVPSRIKVGLPKEIVWHLDKLPDIKIETPKIK